MKKKLTRLFLLLVLTVNLNISVNSVYAAENDTPTITTAVNQFYAALNAMFAGDPEPMKAVWSHANDVTYMGPAGGFQKGWSEVVKVWDEHAALKLGGKVIPDQMEITTGQDIAITHNYELGENFDENGALQKISIRATNIFRKEGGEWKMIGHHTDLLPYLEKETKK